MTRVGKLLLISFYVYASHYGSMVQQPHPPSLLYPSSCSISCVDGQIKREEDGGRDSWNTRAAVGLTDEGLAHHHLSCLSSSPHPQGSHLLLTPPLPRTGWGWASEWASTLAFPLALAHPTYLSAADLSYLTLSTPFFTLTHSTRWHSLQQRLYFRKPWWFRERI